MVKSLSGGEDHGAVRIGRHDAPEPGLRASGCGTAGALGSGAVALHRPWKAGKAPFFRTSPSSASTSATADPGPCVPWTGTRWGWTSSRSPCGVPLFSTACSPQRSGPGCWGWGDDPEAFTQLWTLKESFCKFTGLGLTRPVSAIPVPLPRQILPSGACLPFGSVCFTPVLRPRLAGRRLLSCPLRLLHPLAHAGATPSRWKENPQK